MGTFILVRHLCIETAPGCLDQAPLPSLAIVAKIFVTMGKNYSIFVGDKLIVFANYCAYLKTELGWAFQCTGRFV